MCPFFKKLESRKSCRVKVVDGKAEIELSYSTGERGSES